MCALTHYFRINTSRAAILTLQLPSMKSLVEYAAGYFQNLIKERGFLKDTHNGIKHFVFIPAPLQIFSMMTLDINYGIHPFRLNRD